MNAKYKAVLAEILVAMQQGHTVYVIDAQAPSPTKAGQFALQWMPRNQPHRVVLTQDVDANGTVLADCLDCTERGTPYRASSLNLLPSPDECHETLAQVILVDEEVYDSPADQPDRLAAILNDIIREGRDPRVQIGTHPDGTTPVVWEPGQELPLMPLPPLGREL